MFFENKNILVCVSGGIAVYKACELVRLFKKQNANVRVIMTEAAQKFVSPLTFETLSEYPVLTTVFPEQGGLRTAHIDWAKWADVAVVCPATANTIAKIANGIADNALTTVIMATEAPKVICPAMNTKMYENSIYVENENKLVEHGYVFVEPDEGNLACGDEGKGRLPELEKIVWSVQKTLVDLKDMVDTNVLITAGPTREPLDPVRFLTNYSSGKMGFALAEIALLRGANVTLISGPTFLQSNQGIKLVNVSSAEEMYQAVNAHYSQSDVLIMSAAVNDYRPQEISTHKIKKSDADISLSLKRTTDILKSLGEKKADRIHVGFSVETENGIENTRKKLLEKKCDFFVLNNPLEEGAGFQSDTNRVIIVSDNNQKELPLSSKHQVAMIICDEIVKRRAYA